MEAEKGPGFGIDLCPPLGWWCRRNLDSARRAKQGIGILPAITCGEMAEKRWESHNPSFFSKDSCAVGCKQISSFTMRPEEPWEGPRIALSPPMKRMMKWPFKYKSLEPRTGGCSLKYSNEIAASDWYALGWFQWKLTCNCFKWSKWGGNLFLNWIPRILWYHNAAVKWNIF